MESEIIIIRLFYGNFSKFLPFIRLWVVFLDWITIIYISKFLKSKLPNIPYKDVQNLSSPSDCIQFPVSDNERMTTSCIIHISDSRNSTVNWSWGVETQTGFECIITTIVHCKKRKKTWQSQCPSHKGAARTAR